MDHVRRGFGGRRFGRRRAAVLGGGGGGGGSTDGGYACGAPGVAGVAAAGGRSVSNLGLLKRRKVDTPLVPEACALSPLASDTVRSEDDPKNNVHTLLIDSILFSN